MANSRNYSSIPNGKLNVIGSKIQLYRKAFPLSRQELSDKLILLGIDIPEKAIYHLEKGTRTIVDFEICAIAKVLKIPVQNLLIDYYDSLDK